MATDYDEYETSLQVNIRDVYRHLARIHGLRTSNDGPGVKGPPASQEIVQNLPTVVITKDDKLGECAVCAESLQVNVQVTQLPCNHMFHLKCILPWLSETNSCPICRHELPTDDQEYEAAKKLMVLMQRMQAQHE